MLEYYKNVQRKVRLDKLHFKKELRKSIGWVSKNEVIALKIWALTTFSKYKNTILEVFDRIP